MRGVVVRLTRVVVGMTMMVSVGEGSVDIRVM